LSLTLRIAARSSPLSRLQVVEATPALKRVWPEAEFECRFLESIGDIDQKTALTDASVPQDFFTRELDDLQRKGEIDLVLHSAKDLPQPISEGLCIAAMLPARDTRDSLVIREGVDLSEGGRIGTSSPLREAEIRKRYPKIECKPIRGSIGRRLEQLDAGDYEAVIIAGCALQRLGIDDRISEWLDYETTPLQGRLAITVAADRQDLIHALKKLDVRRQAGMVALMGCPADVRLLGTRAWELIEQADVVLHDRLIPEEIKVALGERGEYVGKKGHAHSTTQAHIHRRILHEAEQGKLVLRLHGGDPAVLGHMGETLEYCRSWNLRCEVIPAVSAAQVCAAKAAASLTHRFEGRSIQFLSGHKGLSDHSLEALAPAHGNLAIYMGVRDIAVIQQRLLEAGWPEDTSVTAGMFLGSEKEQILRSELRNIVEEPLASPAVLLVGPKGLPTDATLFTGTNPVPFLRHGPFVSFPMIDLEPKPLDARVQILKERLASWDGIIFSSGKCITRILEPLMQLGDLRLLAGKTLLAVGPHTAKQLEKAGLKADAVAPGFGGAAALAELPDLKAGCYAYITSDRSPLDERRAALAPRGIELDPVIVHRHKSMPEKALPEFPFRRVLFTSASTVEEYFRRYPEELEQSRDWLAVGSSTARALESRGLHAMIL